MQNQPLNDKGTLDDTTSPQKGGVKVDEWTNSVTALCNAVTATSKELSTSGDSIKSNMFDMSAPPQTKKINDIGNTPLDENIMNDELATATNNWDKISPSIEDEPLEKGSVANNFMPQVTPRQEREQVGYNIVTQGRYPIVRNILLISLVLIIVDIMMLPKYYSGKESPLITAVGYLVLAAIIFSIVRLFAKNGRILIGQAEELIGTETKFRATGNNNRMEILGQMLALPKLGKMLNRHPMYKCGMVYSCEQAVFIDATGKIKGTRSPMGNMKATINYNSISSVRKAKTYSIKLLLYLAMLVLGVFVLAVIIQVQVLSSAAFEEALTSEDAVQGAALMLLTPIIAVLGVVYVLPLVIFALIGVIKNIFTLVRPTVVILLTNGKEILIIGDARKSMAVSSAVIDIDNQRARHSQAVLHNE